MLRRTKSTSLCHIMAAGVGAKHGVCHIFYTVDTVVFDHSGSVHRNTQHEWKLKEKSILLCPHKCVSIHYFAELLIFDRKCSSSVCHSFYIVNTVIFDHSGSVY